MSEVERLVKFFRCEYADCHYEWQAHPRMEGKRPPKCAGCGRMGWWDGNKPPYKKPGRLHTSPKLAKPMSGSEILRRLIEQEKS